MTISNAAATGVTTATGSRGTTSTTVAYVGVAAGRLAVITAGVKPSTATFPATLTDGAGKTWDKVADGTGGTGTNAADTGLTRIAKYVRVLDGAESGSVTITPSSSPGTTTAVMDTYASTLGGWQSPWGATGSDASHGTNPTAATAALSRALTAGDWVHAGFSADTDSTTATTGQAISQTSTTFGTVTARSRLGNQDGNDASVFSWDAPVSSGGAATAVTLTLTWAASSCGPLCALALRESTPQTLTASVVDAYTGTTINTGLWDAWGGAQITQNGQRNLATTTAANYYGCGTLAAYDLSNTYYGHQLVSAGNQALTSYTAYPIGANWSPGNEVYWAINQNTVRFFTNIGGVQTPIAAFPHLPNLHKHFAIGITSGSIRAVWSADGTNWVTETSVANPFGGTNASLWCMVGTDATEASATTLSLDNFTAWSAAVATNGTATVAGSGSLAAGAATGSTASISGAGSVSASGSVVVNGTASVSGSGLVAATGAVRINGTATVAGAGTVSATASAVTSGTATVAGTGSTTAAATLISGTTVTGSGSVTAGAAGVVQGTAAVAGAGSTTAAATTRPVATVQGAGSVSAAATRSGTASTAGSGTVAASAAALAGSAVAGSGSVSAAATHLAGSTVAGVGAVTAGAGGVVQGAASVTGSGSVTATATARSTAAVTGSGAVAAATAQAAGSAVAGAGSVAAGAAGTTYGTATIAAAGSVAAAATARSSASRAGLGAVSATGTVLTRATASITGAGTVTAAARQLAGATVAGSGQVAASGRAVTYGTAAVAGAGFVTANVSQDVTPRPFAGITLRPDAGSTGHPTAVTERPFAGVTPRP